MKIFGKILAVNISQKKGEKKSNIDCGLFLENLGLANDAHAEPGIRQVSLLAKESIEKIKEKGLDVQYGDFAENLTTEGIDLPSLPVGTKLKVGNKVNRITSSLNRYGQSILQAGNRDAIEEAFKKYESIIADECLK